MPSGVGMAILLQSKAFSNYATIEVKKFVVEAGRTYGYLQCDKEPAIQAIARAVVRDLGGLSLRAAPAHQAQSQGSVAR